MLTVAGRAGRATLELDRAPARPRLWAASDVRPAAGRRARPRADRRRRRPDRARSRGRPSPRSSWRAVVGLLRRPETHRPHRATCWPPASRCGTDAMQTYSAPLADFRFLLRRGVRLPGSVAALPRLRGGAARDGARRAGRGGGLRRVGAAAAERHRRPRGLHASRRRGHARRRGSGRPTRRSSRAAGAGSRSRAEHGGSGLPEVVSVAFEEMVCSANLAFATYPLLTAGRPTALCRARLGRAGRALRAAAWRRRAGAARCA